MKINKIKKWKKLLISVEICKRKYYNNQVARKTKENINGGTMDLEEANFILNQLSISQPCISGYMCITPDQIDEAVEVMNNELEARNLKIKQLEKEIQKSKIRQDNRAKKENISKYTESLLKFNRNSNQKELVII